jgi:hypothetical protein
VEPFFFIGYLISIAIFGLYQAIFMANAGGAWDNAKKIVEVELKQKGTPLHDATVVGDTVGDPFKDTSSVASTRSSSSPRSSACWPWSSLRRCPARARNRAPHRSLAQSHSSTHPQHHFLRVSLKLRQSCSPSSPLPALKNTHEVFGSRR